MRGKDRHVLLDVTAELLKNGKVPFDVIALMCSLSSLCFEGQVSWWELPLTVIWMFSKKLVHKIIIEFEILEMWCCKRKCSSKPYTVITSSVKKNLEGWTMNHCLFLCHCQATFLLICHFNWAGCTKLRVLEVYISVNLNIFVFFFEQLPDKPSAKLWSPTSRSVSTTECV